ncbi:MAG TPA: ComF family protein [Hyphomicrobium sp.]|nr:ComF family protein [Hyphomicrobium sp.]
MSTDETIEGAGLERRAARPPLAAVQAGLRRAICGLADIILPPSCVGCQRRAVSHDTLCPSCWRGIDFICAPLCDRLGIPLPYDTGGVMISAAAVSYPPDYDRARAVALYNGLMRRLIHDLKYKDTHHARRLFGRWLTVTGGELIANCDVIAAVPLARGRLIMRRFNQAQILANEVARLSGKPVAPLALARTRKTRQQVGLSRSERQRNVAGAFAVPAGQVSHVGGRAVLLIDDVITTGATASAAARALKKAGARRVDVLALAIAGSTPVGP